MDDPGPKDVVIWDSLPQTTRSGLESPSATGKGKVKIIFDIIIEEYDDDSVSKSFVQSQID